MSWVNMTCSFVRAGQVVVGVGLQSCLNLLREIFLGACVHFEGMTAQTQCTPLDIPAA